MGSSGTLGSRLSGGVGVGVGEGMIGRSRRESAILNALAKGSSLQEAVRDKGMGGGARSVSVGGDLSSLSTSSMIEAGEAAAGAGTMGSAAAEPAAAVMAAAGGLKISRTSSIDRVSSSPQLPHGSDVLLGAGVAGSLPMAEAADSGSGVQPGGMRVSSAPQVPAAAAAAGSSAGGLGGLVPKRNRRLDISGQNKFTPRKDYPPSSMLFQAMRTHYGNDYSSRDLPDTPAACWALVVSAQEARRGTRKLSTANYMQEQPATYDAETEGSWLKRGGGRGASVEVDGGELRGRDPSAASSAGNWDGGSGGGGGGGWSSFSTTPAPASATPQAAAAAAGPHLRHDRHREVSAASLVSVSSVDEERGRETRRSGAARSTSAEMAPAPAPTVREEATVAGPEEVGGGAARAADKSVSVEPPRAAAAAATARPVPSASTLLLPKMPPGDGGGGGSGVVRTTGWSEDDPYVAPVGDLPGQQKGFVGAEPHQWEAGKRAHEQQRGRGRGEGGGSVSGDLYPAAARDLLMAGAAGGAGGGGAGREGLEKVRTRSRSHSMHMGDVGVNGLDLPINTFSCTVGLKLSQANYYIKSSAAAAALCKEASFRLPLSQAKDKEDYGSFEGYEDGAGVYVQYAVANQQGAARAPPHTSSASNIAGLDIVVGSQVPDGNGSGGGGGGGGGGATGERFQPMGYLGRSAKRSLTPSMNYNQVSTGWSDFAEAIDAKHVDDGAGGFSDLVSGVAGGDGQFGGGRGGLSGWDFDPPDSVPAGFTTLRGGGGSGSGSGGGSSYRPGTMKHARSAGSISTSALGWQTDGAGAK
ncbi:unnamed protein product [Ectocarpus sp. 13 AM-2016]